MSSLTLYHTIPTSNDPMEDGFGNTVGKGKISGNHIFSTVFSNPSQREIIITTAFNLSSANAFNSDLSNKFVVW